MHGDGFEQVLSDDDGLATSMDPRVYSQDSAGELDSEDLTACNRVETVPFRHVSFAETVEMVEFDPVVHAAPATMVEYDTPAPNMAYRAHAAPAPMVEYDATLMMAHQAHAAPAPMAEYDAAPTMAYQVYAAPVTVVEYDAPAPIVAHTGTRGTCSFGCVRRFSCTCDPFSSGGRANRQGRACSSGTGRGEDNRDRAVADYRENRRYSRNPDCP